MNSNRMFCWVGCEVSTT